MPVALGIAARGQVARNLIGLPEEELRILRKCLLNRGKAAAAVLDDVLEAKRTALKTDGLLETCGEILRSRMWRVCCVCANGLRRERAHGRRKGSDSGWCRQKAG